MDRFLGVICFRPVAGPGPFPCRESTTARCLGGCEGVQAFQLDEAGTSLNVRFDRSQVTLADLVRILEDAGLVVCSLSQERESIGADRDRE